MSWDKKEDYCGLANGASVKINDSDEGATGSYLEKVGEHGDIVATKAYGTKNASPKCVYTIADDGTLAIKLGTVTTIDGKQYMLESVSISTGGASEPTLEAAAKRVEDGATTGCTFDCPSLTISPDEHAQILFNAFSLSGDGCELTQCSAEVSCTVGLSKINGDPVASDPHTAHVQLSVTILQTGETKPDVTPADGWDLSAPLSCSDPDSDLPTWTCGVSKPIAKTLKA